MFYEVVPIRLFRENAGVLTYAAEEPIEIGTIVEVPLGKKSVVGVVVKKVAQPDFATKKILKKIYSTPLPSHLVKTLEFFAEYYLAPMPSTLALMLPNGVEKARRKTLETVDFTEQNVEELKKLQIPLNNAQKNALIALQKAPQRTKLLHGVTGSGKTNIYLEMAKKALLEQKSVILLVPEIALTGQLVRVFEETFGQKVVMMHSGMTEAERHLTWESLLGPEEAISRGRSSGPSLRASSLRPRRNCGCPREIASSVPPRIIIGPRSALFAPVHNLGLIIVDECHENSYFQENAPKYSAIRVASFMAKTLGTDCILGSATPNAVDYHIAKNKGSLVVLKEKAKDTAIEPKISVIDFKSRELFTKNRYFATPLLKQIEDNLSRGYQTLIFHNRRGSSPLSLCEDCGEELLCPSCFLPLTLHADTYELVCHTCNYHQKVPHACPKCGSINILHKGFGTKLLETELKKLFKNARVARFDADNKKNDRLEVLYDEVKSGKIDILIGTQGVAKGLDLPNLATVGVVQADAGLSLPDFAAEERTFELITQVIGRVGRGHLDTANVYIQTFRPESETLKYACKADYEHFVDYLLKKRRTAGFPPFKFLAKVEITMKTEAIVVKKVRDLYRKLSQNPVLTVAPPMPAFHEHTARGYTWQLIIRGKSRKELVANLSGIDANFRVTLDPPSLL